MIVNTKAIVFSAIKYGEADLIVTCFTEKSGVKSYLLRNILKSKKSALKPSYFQPLSQLNLIANHKNKGTLEYLREAKPIVPYRTLHTDIIKGSLVMFLSEILKNCIREEEPNIGLFEFLSHSLLWLDEHEEVANFHIYFLLELSRFLGFYPDADEIENPYFNLMEGRFEVQQLELYGVDRETSSDLKLFFNSSLENLKNIRFSKSARSAVLEVLLTYYQLHVQGYKKPKSLAVFNTLFN